LPKNKYNHLYFSGDYMIHIAIAEAVENNIGE
jgi:hypothetical protein